MNSPNDGLRAEDDGMVSPEVGRWAETKYRLAHLYAQLFATGMKDKWDSRVYIDLYSGAGFSRIRGTSIFLKGSPILALSVRNPFDKYIFCEESPACLTALEVRAKRIAPGANVTCIQGDCSARLEQIIAAIPKPSSSNKVLSLCFADPFDFGLKFEVLRRLSEFYIDFLVLLAVGMDANRNYDHYVDGNSTKIDEALGNKEWRNRWKDRGMKRTQFRTFLAEEFALSMTSLGYLDQRVYEMKEIHSTEKNLPLYYLALFSRRDTGLRFWKEVLKYSDDQTSFGWE